jgi:hypothetical protein
MHMPPIYCVTLMFVLILCVSSEIRIWYENWAVKHHVKLKH